MEKNLTLKDLIEFLFGTNVENIFVILGLMGSSLCMTVEREGDFDLLEEATSFGSCFNESPKEHSIV